MVEVLLKALKNPKDHAHIEKTLPVFFREWQGGFAVINSATAVDECKDCLDSKLFASVLTNHKDTELVGRLLARSFVGPTGMQVLHRSMLELENARKCKHAKERSSLLIENVVFAESEDGPGVETEVVKELRADLGALLCASSVKKHEEVPENDDPERVDWWADFINSRAFQWGQRYAVNQQCKLILEAIADVGNAEGNEDEEDQE